MRKKALAVAALVLLSSAGASAQSMGGKLDRARSEDRTALQTLHSLQARLRVLRNELAGRRHAVDAATRRLFSAQGLEQDAILHLATLQDTLNGRVRAVYEMGPAEPIDLYLGAKSPGDFLSVDEFTSSILAKDRQSVDHVERARAVLRARREELSARQRAVVARERAVADLLDRMQARVSQARSAARAAGLRVAALERQQRAIEAAQREAARRAAAQASMTSSGANPAAPSGPVPDPPGGFDQSHLLSLLGPTGGRTCSTPSGLRDTGVRISGDASWYGEQFAGQTTASGAIFDPSLFTAAHRTLPFGTFLRVHFRGRCAIVLVNDRGPYGNYNRIIDLSHGAAQYLGVGVNPVVADVFVPRS